MLMHQEIAVALDFETADFQPDSACAIGMARISSGGIEDLFYSRIRPPRSKVFFTHIHGLTWPMLRDARPFAQLWEQIDSFMAGADYLIAHNAGFDRAVLAACCASNGLPAPQLPFLCTLRGARKGLNLRHNRLNDVCEHLCIDLRHHDAESDALASARIYLHLRQNGMPLEEMLLRTAKKPAKPKFDG